MDLFSSIFGKHFPLGSMFYFNKKDKFIRKDKERSLNIKI